MNGNRWHYSVANQCCVESPKIQLRTVYRIQNFVYQTLSKYYYYLAETEFRTLQYSEPFNFINRNKTSYTKYKQLHYILSSGVFKTIYKVSLFVTFLLPPLGLYKHNQFVRVFLKKTQVNVQYFSSILIFFLKTLLLYLIIRNQVYDC